MSKNTPSVRATRSNTQQQLDNLLEALVYLVSQRQMRAHWAPVSVAARR
jgi:hypothetical protein